MTTPTTARALLLGAIVGAAVLASTATDLAAADTLTRTNGQTLTGRLIAEDKDAVVFEVQLGGMSMRQRVPRAQVAKLVREVREGPGYCPIPLTGEIGREVTAEALKRALDQARKGKPQYVVLVIDSLGGSVAEKEKIIDLIRRTRDVKFIAHVKEAISAAAVVALACERIYVTEDGRIGATVAVQVQRDGSVKVMEEKFQSAVRATDRAAAAHGGHSDLWVRAMSEAGLELGVVTRDGKPRLVELAAYPHADVVKRRGQVLTLTGAEAARWGLAQGTSSDVAGIRDGLGLAAWHKTDDQPWHIMASAAKQAQRLRGVADRLRERMPELTTVNSHLSRAQGHVIAAEIVLKELTRKRDAELAALAHMYQNRIAQARSRLEINRVEKLYHNARSNLESAYGRQIEKCEEELARAKRERDRLNDERDTLISSIDGG